MDLDKVLITTVVGSYPAKVSREKLIRSYYEDEDPYQDALKDAVDAQVNAGIELVSDGQTRNGMVEIFAQNIKGFRIKEKIQIISEIEHNKPIVIEDIKKVNEIIPESCGVKAVLTGPWTLVKSVENKYYENEEEAIFDCAEAVKEEAELLTEFCDVIQIDEPFFSIEYPDYGDKIVEKISSVDVPTALHVCGDVESIIEDLIEIDIDILDHEFAANPHLYDAYAGLDIDKKMCVGVVSTDNRVEDINEIKKNINRAYDTFGPKVMIDPDCGLRNLVEEKARKKLENMVIARNVVLNERNRENKS